MNYPKGKPASLKSADGFVVRLTGISGAMTLPVTVKVEVTPPAPPAPPTPPAPAPPAPSTAFISLTVFPNVIRAEPDGFAQVDHVQVKMFINSVQIEELQFIIPEMGSCAQDFARIEGVKTYTFTAKGSSGYATAVINT
jgi:hypothetical protein